MIRINGRSSLPRPLKPDERLILITQDCDLLSTDEAAVEALLCKPHTPDERVYQAANSNSARYFLVNPDTGFVAYAAFRVLLKKRSLPSLHPLNWPSDAQRHKRFIRWLAHRYDRPALPDALHELFEAKVNAAITTLHLEEPEIARILNNICREWRINAQTREEPPFDVHLLMVLKAPRVTANEADALSEVLDRLRDTIDPQQIKLHDDVRKLSPEQITWADVEATVPLFLEPHTYGGAEIGAEPLSRA